MAAILAMAAVPEMAGAPVTAGSLAMPGILALILALIEWKARAATQETMGTGVRKAR